VPKLRINRLYAEILSRERGPQHAGIEREADHPHAFPRKPKWLLKNVHQPLRDHRARGAGDRPKRQKHFFDHGRSRHASAGAAPKSPTNWGCTSPPSSRSDHK